MFLAELFSTTLGEDLGKVSITAKPFLLKKIYKTIMSEQHVHYNTEPLQVIFVKHLETA